MDSSMPVLRPEEMLAFKLRALYEEQGYGLFRMSSFEEYDLYMQNRSFLIDDDMITFTGADGRLMALRPDVTLSIVKSVQPKEKKRLYYNENVFRRDRQTGQLAEIRQMGLEYIGGDGLNTEAEVLALAAKSLAAAGRYALDLSHMEVIEAVLSLFEEEDARQEAIAALQTKSSHIMRQAALKAGLQNSLADSLASLTALAGPFVQVMPQACRLLSALPDAKKALSELQQLYDMLVQSGVSEGLRLDFSILNDVNYYNGLIFQGYVEGVAQPVLSGGRYDSLLRRFGKPQNGLGFALYLDAITSMDKCETALPQAETDIWLNVALPKGRMANKVHSMFEKAGFAAPGILDESRRLVLEDKAHNIRYFLVKPTDVDSYVEHGAADIGVVGKDVLLESGADVLELLDMGLGRCRLAVAGYADYNENTTRPLRVATKYPSVTRRYYAAKSRSVEIINLHGSIELAPILGLSDVIVDIVETGTTLKENNLAVLAEIEPSSARLVANRAAWRFKEPTIRKLVKKLEEQL